MPRRNVITLLKKDHKTVRGLLARLEETTERSAAKRKDLVLEIEREVKAHTRVEEEIVYPAYRDAARSKEDKKLFLEAHEEHDIAYLALERLKEVGPDDESFAARAKVLKDLIEHHAKEEEREMFPRMKKHMKDAALEELGDRAEERKAELLEALEASAR